MSHKLKTHSYPISITNEVRKKRAYYKVQIDYNSIVAVLVFVKCTM